MISKICNGSIAFEGQRGGKRAVAPTVEILLHLKASWTPLDTHISHSFPLQSTELCDRLLFAPDKLFLVPSYPST